jgi:diguanylate cyclase (GGDEF)-like protein
VNDAYLISPTRGAHLSEFPRLEHCVTTGLYVTLTEDGQHVCVLPVFRNESLHLLVELVRAAPFAADELVLAQSVLDFFRDHLALIDYAETDTLTGLLNRKTFDEHLDRVLTTVSDDSLHEANAAHPLRRHPQLNVARNWLAIIDIDHFKRINDTHGHLIGDEVLLLLAQLMGDAFRLDDQLFRFGGEEFVVVLQPTGLAEARKVLERFRERIEKHEFSIIGHMTVSLGFTEIQYFDNPLDLIDRADKALYYAKQHGRNRVENYEELFAAGLVDKGPERKKSDVELF